MKNPGGHGETSGPPDRTWATQPPVHHGPWPISMTLCFLATYFHFILTREKRLSKEISWSRRCLAVVWLCVLVTVPVDEQLPQSRYDDEFDSVILRPCRHAQLSNPVWCMCVCVCWFPLCCFQVMAPHGEPRLPLDLKPRLNYTIQVRCSSLDQPPLWSDWSEPHHIYLDSKNHSLPAVDVETEK